MQATLLDWIRCPFCGTRLQLVDNAALARDDTRIEAGVLGCECCAFPVIAGIPILLADDATRTAMHALERGDRDEALATALDVSRTEAAELARAAGAAALTYREAISVLAPDAEGTYFLHRFSDPTFVSAEALVRVLSGVAPAGGPWLDLCGGTGHLAHALAGGRGGAGACPRGGRSSPICTSGSCGSRPTSPTPAAGAVCCSADAPLPFTSDRFSMVVLHGRVPLHLAQAAVRGRDDEGGASRRRRRAARTSTARRARTTPPATPLSPSAYRDLFAPFRPALLSDARLLDGLLDDACLDLRRRPVARTAPRRALPHPRGEPAGRDAPAGLRTGAGRPSPACSGSTRCTRSRSGTAARCSPCGSPPPEYEEPSSATAGAISRTGCRWTRI